MDSLILPTHVSPNQHLVSPTLGSVVSGSSDVLFRVPVTHGLSFGGHKGVEVNPFYVYSQLHLYDLEVYSTQSRV